jgi:hypothetical protein
VRWRILTLVYWSVRCYSIVPSFQLCWPEGNGQGNISLARMIDPIVHRYSLATAKKSHSWFLRKLWFKKKRKWSIPIIGHPNFIFQKNQREIVICHHYFFYLFLLFFIFSECCKSKVANISVFFYAYRVMGEDERKKRKKEAVSSGETTTISYCYHWWWENRKWDFWYNILRFLSCFPPFSFCYSNRARKHQISYHDSRGVENV